MQVHFLSSQGYWSIESAASVSQTFSLLIKSSFPVFRITLCWFFFSRSEATVRPPVWFIFIRIRHAFCRLSCVKEATMKCKFLWHVSCHCYGCGSHALLSAVECFPLSFLVLNPQKISLIACNIHHEASNSVCSNVADNISDNDMDMEGL